MRRTAFLISWFLAVAVVAFAAPVPTSPRPVVEWNFDAANDFLGWQANGHIAEARVADGVLSCRTTGADPILELRPVLDFPASARQFLEARIKADRDGPAEFFWSNTTQSKYGGFSGDKRTPFQIVGDGQWRVYRIFPGWQTEGKIVRLRFDLFSSARFELDYLRVMQLPERPASASASFVFSDSNEDWIAAGPMRIRSDAQGLQVSAADSEAFLLGPPPRVDAVENTFVTLRMRVERGTNAAVLFATDRQPGWHSLRFPITADGEDHWYNVDLLPAPDWQGNVVALGLQPTDAVGALATVFSLAVTSHPAGPPKLEVLSFALDDAAPRAGVPTRISAVVANLGGSVASNLTVNLETPPPVKVLSARHPQPLPALLGFSEEMTASWLIESPSPFQGRARLMVKAGQGEPVVAQASLDFPPRPNIPQSDYVPEPKPVRGKYDVGVYYFPGWKSASQWHPIHRFPERKPVLGWYREGDPEVADWHIKYAVEHGITFFAYDWYWSAGARQLEHGLHDGYFKARYRHLLKFCLLWANHNPPKTHSLDDCLAVTRFWIANYFQRPEYYRIDGKPVMIIFSPHNLVSDLGVAGVNGAFAAMREECRRAGLPGLYLAACVGGVHQVDGQAYDAVTAYNWPGLGVSGGEKRAPFSSLIEGYRKQWLQFLEQGNTPLLLPVCGGWDSRPWHGDAALVRFGRNPELFRRHLQDARRLLETRANSTNLLPAILIEAWNEWGEGSYIEPHQEFGFGYLEAIRDVFADAPAGHLDLAPVDVGLGPYDVAPQPPSRTAWSFDRDAEGFDNTMHLGPIHVADGVLVAKSTGNDPALFGPPIQVRASGFPVVTLRLRLTSADGGSASAKDMAQLFWRTRRWPESEASSLRFPVEVDGQWHVYRLPVGENRRWTGIITRLRLDPATKSRIKIELDSLRLENK